MATQTQKRRFTSPSLSLSNSDIAELLALEAERVEKPVLAKALRKAARAAFLWPEEAGALVASDRSLTELDRVGPFIDGLIRQWFEKPPKRSKEPPLRRNFLTLSAVRNLLIAHPDWELAYKGDLQMHTDWSDGSGTVAEMADAAELRDYEYIAITDHSQGLKIAGGIDEKELKKQAREIDEFNEGSPVKVLKSIELNLNPSGQGDMDSGALRKLDLVVGSFHSALRTPTDQTERYLAALRNPDVHILGHPRGRVYNYRLGLQADWTAVFAEAARLDKAIEVDSYPDRQDIDVELLQLAKEEGCKIAIDTDAHHPYQLGFAELGLASTLMVGIEPENIINFMSLDKLLAWSHSHEK